MSTKLLIVGAVAGGATAAARARRLDEHAEIVLIERGPDVSFANCGLPYHIGGEIQQRDALLLQTPEGLRDRFQLDIRTGQEAISIDRAGRTLRIRELESGRAYDEPYDYLLLSPGAAPIRPPIPGVELPQVQTLRSLSDTDRIKRLVDDGARSVVVVGGGFIGLEMAENLRRRGLDVALVELLSQVMPPFDPEMAERLHVELAANDIDLYLEDGVTGFERADDRTDAALRVRLKSGRSLLADMAILAVGVRPESKLARDAGLELNERGAIVVDERMQTSDPHIFAVGDAVEVHDAVLGVPMMIPLAGPANREARVAADNIFGRDSRYRGSQGTSIVRVFEAVAAMTGLSEKLLKSRGVAHRKVYVHPRSHAGYFPGSQAMTIKLLFAPDDGRVLGAQIIGGEGVDKRIDVIAMAIRGRMTVADLAEAELAYAPQFGTAKDAVNVAGLVALNVLRGDDEVTHADELDADALRRFTIVDVRQPAEFEAGAIPGAVNIPLPELRKRIGERAAVASDGGRSSVPAPYSSGPDADAVAAERLASGGRPLLIYCAAGQRGYYAARVLRQRGLPCRNLSGGFAIWRSVNAKRPIPTGRLEERPMTSETPSRADTTSYVAASASARTVQTVDVRGLCCPGPIATLAAAARAAGPQTILRVEADDVGFAADLPAWCKRTGNELLEMKRKGREFVAEIRVGGAAGAAADGAARSMSRKGPAPRDTGETGPQEGPVAASAAEKRDKCFVVFSGDLDRVMASLILANTAASMGDRVTLFFTFWGLAALRRPDAPATSKPLMQRMLGWMLPRGAGRLKLSRMHMGGAGTAMMKGLMKSKGLASLPEMIRSAQESGVRIVACSLAMEMLGMPREELLEGIEVSGAAGYLDAANDSGVNLFI